MSDEESDAETERLIVHRPIWRSRSKIMYASESKLVILFYVYSID